MSGWIGKQVFVQITGPNPQSYRGRLAKEDPWSLFLETVIDEKTETEYLGIKIDAPPNKTLHYSFIHMQRRSGS